MVDLLRDPFDAAFIRSGVACLTISAGEPARSRPSLKKFVPGRRTGKAPGSKDSRSCQDSRRSRRDAFDVGGVGEEIERLDGPDVVAILEEARSGPGWRGCRKHR